MEDKKYMTSGVTYSEEIAPGKSNWLRVDMLAFANAGSHELMIKVYTYDNDKQEVHFQGSLNELIELVLLGKLYKEQLQAMDKKEPVAKCDLCSNPAEWFESPLGNTDEPKMCNRHYRKYVEPGARDWDAHHIPLQAKISATEIRELQNNA